MSKALSPATRADRILGILTWGFATLHPRLYATTRFAGSEPPLPNLDFVEGLASYFPNHLVNSREPAD